MSMELKMLVWTVLLGIVHIALAATLSTQQRGLAWNAGPRDNVPAPLTGVAGRLDRASRNFLETFPFFAAAVLAVLFTQHATPETAMGAQIYFWSRVAYLPVYAAGISYLRTLIWVASLAGLVMVLMPLI
ncbi:MAG: MAPEG family protein [Arenimonas sp.]